jgi:DNA helicase-2/ATP-dependent DNA helicase PcrA
MNLVELFNNLDDEQKEAAKDIYGPAMIVAGPGGGKTHTLVARTANMINNGIQARKIILFTFTRKAAKEIRDRVSSLIGDKANDIMIGTYHSVCNRFLRKYTNYIGLTKNFSIYDTEDCEKIISSILKSTKYNLEAKKVLWCISDFKRRLVSPSEAARDAENGIEEQMAEIYKIYSNILNEENAIDLDDLIYKTVRMLQKFPEIKKEINEDFQYIVAELIGPYCGDAVCVSL